ncbi:hypothetical protein K437DRAFT_254736 [Tilletiaria anomala UBC 951]|uniref:Uncharacterized protein n=1 Tax=Tilletiaria anomala (strain ATCC 24038 / CBS 436.72 / UBC 951) TaxID=1037660 RepID=A0A066WDI9_TILAU|nr:uncharacterized protein K437DRAFT_254736 [Tilletiaria anomala UBC 951]KDN51997.1 hypothetical protein K437DRAFT_254736 [Tilletiaria anomala UBC 951]
MSRRSKALPQLPNDGGPASSSASTVVGEHSSISAALAEREDGVWVNVTKQAKFILLGGIPVWYLDVHGSVLHVLTHGGEDWTRTLGLVTLVFLTSTVVLLAYLVLLPTRGVTPNWTKWNKDAHLRGLIPALTMSIIGGYIMLLLLLSPLCQPKSTMSSVLAHALATRIGAATESAGGNLQAVSKQLQSISSRAAASLFSLHRPLVPAQSSGWFSSGSSEGGSYGAYGSIDTKRLLAALKLRDTASLAAQLNVPAKRLNEFTRSLERDLQSFTLSSLQASLRSFSDAGSAPWIKKGAWGWLRAMVGTGSTYLGIFGLVGLLGIFGSGQKAAQRRRETKAKESL